MNFTFGIVTPGNNEGMVSQIIDSIESQRIPRYEIIVVGNCNIDRDRTTVIPFNENEKPGGWITRKKNIVTNNAKYDNIVYLHDYICLEPDWYRGFLDFGSNFDVCMTKIVNPDGSRYRDWTLWAENGISLGINDSSFLLPYNEDRLTNHMYVSGAYWVAKRELMLAHPLNEALVWGQGEDVIWSKELRDSWNYRMNVGSSVRLLKYKHPIFNVIKEETLISIFGTHGS